MQFLREGAGTAKCRPDLLLDAVWGCWRTLFLMRASYMMKMGQSEATENAGECKKAEGRDL
jgi:hypothetical protein